MCVVIVVVVRQKTTYQLPAGRDTCWQTDWISSYGKGVLVQIFNTKQAHEVNENFCKINNSCQFLIVIFQLFIFFMLFVGNSVCVFEIISLFNVDTFLCCRRHSRHESKWTQRIGNYSQHLHLRSWGFSSSSFVWSEDKIRSDQISQLGIKSIFFRYAFPTEDKRCLDS